MISVLQYLKQASVVEPKPTVVRWHSALTKGHLYR